MGVLRRPAASLDCPRAALLQDQQSSVEMTHLLQPLTWYQTLLWSRKTTSAAMRLPMLA